MLERCCSLGRAPCSTDGAPLSLSRVVRPTSAQKRSGSPCATPTLAAIVQPGTRASDSRSRRARLSESGAASSSSSARQASPKRAGESAAMPGSDSLAQRAVAFSIRPRIRAA